MYYFEKLDKYDFLSEEFAEFFTRSEATAFQNPHWLAGIYRDLAPHNHATPLIITMREKATNKLIFLAPMMKSRKRGMTVIEIADLQVSDYLDFIIDPQFKHTVLEHEQEFINLLEGDIFWADKTIKDDGFIHHFKSLITFNRKFSTHHLPLTSNFEALREEKYNPTFRRSLDKKTGKLHRKGGFSLNLVSDPTKVEAIYDKIQFFRSERFKGTRAINLTNDQNYNNFYKNYIYADMNNSARLYELQCEGNIVAAFLGLYHNEKLSGVLVGYDDNYSNWSTGVVIFDQIIKHLVEEGSLEMDFTIGDEPYKYNFGVTSTPIVVKYIPLSLKGRIYAIGYITLAKAKRVAKKLLKR